MTEYTVCKHVQPTLQFKPFKQVGYKVTVVSKHCLVLFVPFLSLMLTNILINNTCAHVSNTCRVYIYFLRNCVYCSVRCAL